MASICITEFLSRGKSKSARKLLVSVRFNAFAAAVSRYKKYPKLAIVRKIRVSIRVSTRRVESSPTILIFRARLIANRVVERSCKIVRFNL